MANRELLQLAHNYDPKKVSVGGWFASEKLDGIRCFWDGSISRGIPASEVPYANTEKDFRLVDKVIATGLWSRYGKVIRAPDWFLNQLPAGVPLDGELYLGPGQFQEVMSVVKQFNADDRWQQIQFKIFDMPSYERLFMDGKINNPNFKQHEVSFDKIAKFFDKEKAIIIADTVSTMRFYEVVARGNDIIRGCDNVTWHWQEKLPITTQAAEQRIEELLDLVLEKGGEGLVLRKPESIWVPKRTADLLKVKPQNDAEAKVLGYTWGKGKLEGLFGALIVSWCGKQFELSGFSDDERKLYFEGEQFTKGEPGKVASETIYSEQFPRGSVVTFKYRELTDSGLPKEARYFRNAPKDNITGKGYCPNE